MLQRRCFVRVPVAAGTLRGPTDLPEESAVSCQSRPGRRQSSITRGPFRCLQQPEPDCRIKTRHHPRYTHHTVWETTVELNSGGSG